MSDLHGNEPLNYNDGDADALIAACRQAAAAIDNNAASRRSYATHAEQDFQGHFSQLFATNATTASQDGSELSSALRLVAQDAAYIKHQAALENSRRNKARQWIKDHPEHHGFGKFTHAVSSGVKHLVGDDDDDTKKPDMTSGKQPVKPVAAPKQRNRQTPVTGHGGGGSTSSARPASLRFFASHSATLNHSLRSDHLAKVRSTLQAYTNANNVPDAHMEDPKNGWGQLHAHGVVTSFAAWLDANDNDVAWARTIATAFEKAGGQGGLCTLSNAALGAALKAAGVSASRKDLDINMPSCKGGNLTNGFAVDPVNTTTGNFIEFETDLAFAGAASDLELSRMYNSFTTESGAFGPGWSSLAEAGLAIGEESATFTLADGRGIVFPRLGEGWDRATGDSCWLTRDETGDFRVTDNQGGWWVCDSSGRLTSYRTSAGAVISLTHDADGHLSRISHARGRTIDLVWDSERVVSATTSDGRSATYSYDEAGQLTLASTPLGTRHYDWIAAPEDDETGVGLIGKVTDADGVVELLNTYDERRRARTQLTQHGRLVRFSYLPGNVTVVDDEDGTNSNTWISDDRGRLIGIIDSHESRQSTSWDAWGNPVVITERDGSTTIHEYDDRGRRTRTVTPSGADLQYAYDDLDRVTTAVAEAGAVTTFGYDGDERNPSTITDPEGGVTRLTWSDGLVTRLVGPTDVTVTAEHDDAGNLTAFADADGNTARLEYDACGRVTAVITPLGHRTTYRYGDHGLLEQRTDPDGAVWRFEHTAAGRLSATIDPLGARTVIEHDADGERSLLTDPLGRHTELAHDVFGNLSSVTLPDGRVWAYAHDSLSRLNAVTSPDDAVWSATFDDNGNPVGFADPTGATVARSIDRGQGTVETTFAAGSSLLAFDPLGRAIRSVAVDGGETVNAYDRCGRLVESVDAEGGLTRFSYNAAGRLLEVITPTGAIARYEWDHCGRLAATIDATGARTGYAYDADRRLTQVTLPTGEVAETSYDACGRVLFRYVPGVGRSSVSYDAAGRAIEVRDPVNGHRRFTYDAAGQLIEARDGNGGVTRFGHDALGRTVTITNPLGATTRREFDSLGRCTSETDPSGRTTRVGYDAAGRRVWQEDPGGRRAQWTYDTHGQVSSIAVDGVVQSSFEHDLRARRLTIVDRTDPTRECVHELTWNGRQQVLSRSRDGKAVRWTYDADGRRTSMTTPDGSTASYSFDARGRLAAVEHPLFGRASFDHDEAGRLVAAAAGDLMQTWEYVDGYLTAHAVTTADGVSRTSIGRDDEGRIASLDHDGETTAFTYDDACQLVAAVTGSTETTWRYDAAGRLVTETVDGIATDHVYDAAGQLVSTAAPGRRVTYSYDSVGRRTSATDNDVVTTYSWNALGWLASITGTDAGATHTLHVDALGELAEVDGVEVFHDSASWARDLVQIGDVAVLSADALTGIGSGWVAPGWRAARGTAATDPWALSYTPDDLAGLPAGLRIGSGGELSIGGLEWMNARVYDPASRGFLSVDPLDPVTGAGWAGNPYSYAGNDPLHALDPLGLKPATDADLQNYVDGLNNPIGHWLKNNWEYVAAGAAVGLGVLLLATSVVDGPLGAAAGGALISGGISMAEEKHSGADFSKASTWATIGISAGAGALGGGLSGLGESAVESSLANSALDAATKQTAKMGLDLAVHVGSDATSNGLQNMADYTAGAIEGKHGFSVGGLAGEGGKGALAGGIGSFAGGSTAGFGKDLAHEAGRRATSTVLGTTEGAISGGMSGLIGSGMDGGDDAGKDSGIEGGKSALTGGASAYGEAYHPHAH